MTRMEETGVVAQLKEAIRASGRTLGDIGREAGVATSQLSYFLSGQRDLTLTTAGKLFKALGLELVAKRPRPRKEK